MTDRYSVQCIFVHMPSPRGEGQNYLYVGIRLSTFILHSWGGTETVTHAIFFCLFNAFPVYFYSLKLHMYFLTTSHSEIFSCGNRSPGVSAVFFMLPIRSRIIVNKYSEYETNRWVYLVRRAVGMTHLDRRMLDFVSAVTDPTSGSLRR